MPLQLTWALQMWHSGSRPCRSLVKQPAQAIWPHGMQAISASSSMHTAHSVAEEALESAGS